MTRVPRRPKQSRRRDGNTGAGRIVLSDVMKKRYEDLETDDGTVVRYRRHDNGGGLVAQTASVDPTAFVAETAWVDPGAQVGGGARVGAHVWLEPGAVVGPHAQLGTHVHVGRGAVVGAAARLGTRVSVGSGARLAAGVAVSADESIPDHALVTRPDGDPHSLAA